MTHTANVTAGTASWVEWVPWVLIYMGLSISKDLPSTSIFSEHVPLGRDYLEPSPYVS